MPTGTLPFREEPEPAGKDGKAAADDPAKAVSRRARRAKKEEPTKPYDLGYKKALAEAGAEWLDGRDDCARVDLLVPGGEQPSVAWPGGDRKVRRFAVGLFRFRCCCMELARVRIG